MKVTTSEPRTHMQETMANFGLEEFAGYYNYLTKTLQPLLETGNMMAVAGAGGIGYVAGQAIEPIGEVIGLAQRHGPVTALKAVTQGSAKAVVAAVSAMGQMYEQGEQAAVYIASGAVQVGKSAVETVLANKTASIAAAVTVALLAYAGYKYYSKSSELASTQQKLISDLKAQLQSTRSDLELEQLTSQDLRLSLECEQHAHKLEQDLLGTNPKDNKAKVDELMKLCDQVVIKKIMTGDDTILTSVYEKVNVITTGRKPNAITAINKTAEQLLKAMEKLSNIQLEKQSFEERLLGSVSGARGDISR